MLLKVLEEMGDSLFPQYDIALDLCIGSYLDIFATHANIDKIDMEQIVKYDIMCELSMFYEYSEIYMIFNLYARKYRDIYANILAELFLGDMIDFYIIDEPKQPTLLRYKNDKNEAWTYFRDNFIYKERFNAEDFCDTTWGTPSKWSRYNINATLTQKGTKYFNEILAPKFYNKYKDLEVEIDSEGNIIRWIGEIRR